MTLVPWRTNNRALPAAKERRRAHVFLALRPSTEGFLGLGIARGFSRCRFHVEPARRAVVRPARWSLCLSSLAARASCLVAPKREGARADLAVCLMSAERTVAPRASAAPDPWGGPPATRRTRATPRTRATRRTPARLALSRRDRTRTPQGTVTPTDRWTPTTMA